MRYAIAIFTLLLVAPAAVAQVPMNYMNCPPASPTVCCPPASPMVCCPPANSMVYPVVPVQAAPVYQPVVSPLPTTTVATPAPLYGIQFQRMLGGGFTRTGSYNRSVRYVTPTVAPASCYYCPY